jgi:hypothetical protein
MTFRTATLLNAVGMACIGLLAVTNVSSGNPQPLGLSEADQQLIAKQLLSEDKKQRDAALSRALALRAEMTGPVLRGALITLLEQLNTVRAEAWSDNMSAGDVENPETVSAVHRAVARLNDSKAIPALADAMGMFTTVRVLTAFGEQAAPDVLRVVMSPDSTSYAVEDGLRVLRWMIESQGQSPLSAGTLAQIREAADHRLNDGVRVFTTLWYAIDLAMALNEPELRRHVQMLATVPSAVIARGVLDPELIKKTQQRATDRLAGLPAPSRPAPSSD